MNRPPNAHNSRRSLSLALIVLCAGFVIDARSVCAQTQPPACTARDRFFEEEVWAKVGERTCIRCHNSKGDAADSKFQLARIKNSSEAETSLLTANCQQFQTMARATEGGKSRLLAKVTGGLEHGGGQVLKPGSTGYTILERYVRRLNGESTESIALADQSDRNLPPFFDGVTMLPPARLLRRVTLSLAGRLPTDAELNAVNSRGNSAMSEILDAIMREDAFHARLKEGFNDIFLTLGTEDNAETLLSYDHFEKTRLWTEHHDLSHIPESERQRKRWALASVYRESLLREPLELIAYIVKNDRPFTELATADYIMVSPFSARGYGIYNEVKNQFKNPGDSFKAGDPDEYVPVKLKALKNRAGKIQESPTGLYPHAGFLSMFHYLRRYPTTDTNRNRLRARMFYQHFLGIDIMQLAPRNTDASAVASKYAVPTMQAPDCVVCHKTIDPVAGVFQDFDKDGYLGPRKEGWYTDMFKPGFEGEDMPSSQRWRAPQWLAERAVKDPRFPIAMTEHVYSIMMGRKVLQAPEDIDSPTFTPRLRAYRAQRAMIEQIARQFAQANFNLKVAFKALILSDFYRVDGLATLAKNPDRQAELDDVGLVRLLTPEQLDRKLNAIFGEHWSRLNQEMKILYGGIDSLTVTERNTDPSGAMGAIQRIMSNDIACKYVGHDFMLEPQKRVLFSLIESNVKPGDPAADQKIRAQIVLLFQKLHGQDRTPNDPEVDRAFKLFADLIADAHAQGRFEPRETYFCGGREGPRVQDPHYTVRAWRGVVTYLLRQHDFLYE